MKKSLAIILFVLIGVLTLKGQDYKTSLGLRIGYPYGVTVKHFLSEKTAFEGIMAASYHGFVVTGLYEMEYWTGKYPGFNWFWGFGAHVGFWDAGANKYVDDPYYNGAVIGIDGIIGLEYTFDEIPLNLSIDLLPTVNLIGSTGWGGIYGGLSVRYVF